MTDATTDPGDVPEPDTTGSDGVPEAGTDRSSPSRTRRRRLLRRGAAVTVLVALVAGCTALVLGARDAQDDATARQEAVASAKRRLPELVSYHHDELGQDRRTALQQTTGGFRDEYATLLENRIFPTVKSQDLVTSATVTEAAVVSGDTDEVVVLAFVNQSVKNTEQSLGALGSRVELTMTQTSDGWKISGLDLG